MAATRKMCKGGDCIFCTSKCPECGSDRVRARFKPVFEYENGSENQIVISTQSSSPEIELDCDECGRSFSSDEYDEDETLWPLTKALNNVLDVPSYVDIKHDSETGEIEINKRYIVSAENIENPQK
jgi:hypothetical protein